jgi:hypothetical protein
VARAVHDEGEAALQVPEIVPRAVLPSHRAAGVGVAEKPERELQLLGPRQVARRRIGGDADDLGVQRGVLGGVIPEPGEFALSAASERLDVEGDHDEIARLEQIRKVQAPPVLIDEREIGSDVPQRERGRPLGGGDGKDHAAGDEDEESNAPQHAVTVCDSLRRVGIAVAGVDRAQHCLEEFGFG